MTRDDRSNAGTGEVEGARAGELRERLLDAAQRVFATSGYASATVDDIIRAATTSRATFYRYFRSKEDLFDELSRACFREMRVVVKGLAGFDPEEGGREALEQLVDTYRELQARQGGVIRAWMEQVDRPESAVRKEAASTFAALLSGLERPISAVGAPSRITPEVQAALLLVVLTRATFYVLHRHSRVDPDRLAPTLAAMIHRTYFGAAPPGRRGRLRVASED
ncbi:MAG TPA: TetR/AcrR family transcriptional regulator [Acidimicrobiales bacterium]|nr:TetR/AcrR family transcriptional regulator [Acidimicrobiales bacterium]